MNNMYIPVVIIVIVGALIVFSAIIVLFSVYRAGTLERQVPPLFSTPKTEDNSWCTCPACVKRATTIRAKQYQEIMETGGFKMTFWAVVNPSQVIYDVFPTEEKAKQFIKTCCNPKTAHEWNVYPHAVPPCTHCQGCAEGMLSDFCPALMRNQ